MGTIAARKAREIMKNTRNVLAMELLAATQAIDLRGKKKLGIGTEAAYNVLRKYTNFIEEDLVMYKEINKCEEIVKENLVVEAVEKSLEFELLVNEEIALSEI